MSSKKIRFEVEQGVDFDSQIITWKVGNPLAPVDLSGMKARALARLTTDSDDVLFNLTTENGGITLGGTNGTIKLALTGAQSQSYKWRVAICFLDIFDPTGRIIKRFDADVYIKPFLNAP